MNIIDFLRLHGTKVLGFLGVTIGVLAVADPSLVGGDLAIKYFLLAQSLLTVWRGFFTSDAFKVGLVVKAENAEKAATIIKDQRQAGFARALFLALLLAIALPVVVSLSGCSGTQHAFRAAETPDEKAFALLKLYEAAQSEALTIAQTPSTPAAVVRSLQVGAMRAKPAADTLRPLADAYKATGTATTEAELQAAYDSALLVINEFLSTVTNAKQVRP